MRACGLWSVLLSMFISIYILFFFVFLLFIFGLIITSKKNSPSRPNCAGVRAPHLEGPSLEGPVFFGIMEPFFGTMDQHQALSLCLCGMAAAVYVGKDHV